MAKTSANGGSSKRTRGGGKKKGSAAAGGKKRDRVALELGDDDEEDSSKVDKSSDIVVALLEKAARDGLQAKKGSRMPHGWYRDKIVELKQCPGCADVDFVRSDIETKIRRMERDAT